MTKFLIVLRYVRIAVALALFAAISAQFLDIYHSLPKPYFMWNPTATQFAPSLLKMLATGSIFAGAAFLTFSIFALIFGRAYCSFFCPLGIMMDVLRRILRPRKKSRDKMKYMRSLTCVRGFFLIVAIAFISLGYSALFGFLDPYSLYGKIMGDVRSMVGMSANAVSETLYQADIYAVSPVSGNPTISFSAFGAALIILIIIAFATAWKGRIWCNTVCPVGAFLGVLSKFSLFKISLDKSKCVSCGMCERTCKAQCISSKDKRLDFNRCVLCFDCASACHKNAITIVPFWKNRNSLQCGDILSDYSANKKNTPADKSRRKFPKLALALFGILTVSANKELKAQNGHGYGKGNCRQKGQCQLNDENISPYHNPKNAREDSRLAVPPGAKSVENFLDKCTGCQACVAACKSKVLKPSVNEWGLAHFMQPFMDYTQAFCLSTCHSCTKVCPTGAIEFKRLPEKMKIKIGTAFFRRDLCIVKTEHTDCAACAEHCPVQAIEMVPFSRGKKGLYIPYVHKEVCIGCGACESVCPVTPKAIAIRGLSVHTQAKQFEESMRLFKIEPTPKKENIPSQSEDENPFPF